MQILASLKQVQYGKLVEIETAYIEENKAYALDGLSKSIEAGQILSNTDCHGLGLNPSDRYIVRVIYPIKPLQA